MLVSLKEQTMISQNNPCESCIHQSKSWNEDPCNRCGSENNYAWCEDEQGNFLMLSSLKEHFPYEKTIHRTTYKG